MVLTLSESICRVDTVILLRVKAAASHLRARARDDKLIANCEIEKR